jgi:Ni,Fe-hydrogenase I cytochrome b subunit
MNMTTSVLLAIRMSGGRAVGILVAMALSLWAAFVFLRGSITGAPPLYSKGPLRRTLHFTAGLIFVALAVFAVAMLVTK